MTSLYLLNQANPTQISNKNSKLRWENNNVSDSSLFACLLANLFVYISPSAYYLHPASLWLYPLLGSRSNRVFYSCLHLLVIISTSLLSKNYSLLELFVIFERDKKTLVSWKVQMILVADKTSLTFYSNVKVCMVTCEFE